MLTCPPIGTLLVNLIKHEETPRQPSLTRAAEEGGRSPRHKTQLITTFIYQGIETLLCKRNRGDHKIICMHIDKVIVAAASLPQYRNIGWIDRSERCLGDWYCRHRFHLPTCSQGGRQLQRTAAHRMYPRVKVHACKGKTT